MNGELAAAMQYSIQGLNCEDPDIGTEELSHLEVVGCLARLHLKPMKSTARRPKRTRSSRLPALESTRTIEIDEFVPRSEIDDLYLVRPYYIVPDGKVGHDAYAVIRETIRS